MSDSTKTAASILSTAAPDSDSPVQPNPSNVLSQGRPAPSPQNVQTPANILSTPQAAAPQPGDIQKMANAAASANAHVSRLAKFGRFAESLVTGENVNYVPDPDTGEIKEVRTATKPGQLFRAILAGAILGGAAGARAPRDSGFAGGFATGGAAVIQNDQEQNQIKRANAQRELSGEQSAQRIKEDEMYHQAQITQWGLENLRADANSSLNEEHYIQSLNEANSEVEDKIVEKGASPATILVGGNNINGSIANGQDLQKFLTKNPAALHAPQGFGRVFTMHIDTTGLEPDPKSGHWVDSKTGQPVNLASRTAWTAYDVPLPALDQDVEVSSEDLNKLGYKFPPGKSYHLKMSGYISLQTDALKSRTEEADAAVRSRGNNLARNRRITELKDSIAKASAALKDPSTQDFQKSQYQNQIDAANIELQGLGVGSAPKTKSNTANTQTGRHKPDDIVTLKDGTRVRVTSVNKDGSYTGNPIQ